VRAGLIVKIAFAVPSSHQESVSKLKAGSFSMHKCRVQPVAGQICCLQHPIETLGIDMRMPTRMVFKKYQWKCTRRELCYLIILIVPEYFHQKTGMLQQEAHAAKPQYQNEYQTVIYRYAKSSKGGFECK